MEHRADNQQWPGPVAVKYLAADGGTDEHHEGFGRRNPGHGALRVLSELVRLVVVLEYANASYPAKAHKETAPAAKYSQPAPKASFLCRLRGNIFLRRRGDLVVRAHWERVM